MFSMFSEMMVPHSGVGEATPRPRKPMEEMLRMICPRVSVAETTMGPMPLGRMWRRMTFAEPQPKLRAASM